MEHYILTVQKLFKFIIKEPHKILGGSLLFIVLSLPVISAGIAFVVCQMYIKCAIEGTEFKVWTNLTRIVIQYGLRATLIWLIDLCILMLMAGSYIMIGNEGISLPIKFIYLAFVLLEGLFLFSAIYQVPILVYNDFSVKKTVITSFVMSQKNFLFTVLVFSVMLTLLIISVLTGIGVFIIFPGAAAALWIFGYKHIVSKYTLEKNITEVITIERRV